MERDQGEREFVHTVWKVSIFDQLNLVENRQKLTAKRVSDLPRIPENTLTEILTNFLTTEKLIGNYGRV